jgi:CRISPR-associated protein Cmr5
MSIQTRSQKLAREAYARIDSRKPSADYVSVAKRFAAMIHSCGLAQAVAFALAKKSHHKDYLEDLVMVLTRGGHQNLASAQALATATREQSVPSYLRLSRDAIEAAVWLKRYVEAIGEEAFSP